VLWLGWQKNDANCHSRVHVSTSDGTNDLGTEGAGGAGVGVLAAIGIC
jgi:hypothetical protein